MMYSLLVAVVMLLGCNSCLALPPIDTGARITKPTCVDIPSRLGLCHNIGYSTMRMPNLLEHDSLDEVNYQALSWIPLVDRNCHRDTQLFLCSLFAPVCLERLIYPCRSLCQAVRDGCEPLMQQNCFEWPDMLDCDKFPEDNDLCIKSEMLASPNASSVETTPPAVGFARGGVSRAVGQLFTQCHTDGSPEAIFDYSCTADFVLKMRINQVRDTKEGRRYRGDPEKLTVYKQGSLREKDLKKLNFNVREGTRCRCEMLEPSRQFLLVMGHKEGKQLFMTYVHTWSRERDFRSVIRSIQDGVGCPVQTTAPPVVRIPAGNHGEEIPTDTLFPDSEHMSEGEVEETPAPAPSKPKGNRRLTKEERREQRRLARLQAAAEEEAAAAAAAGAADGTK
nr:sFRP1/2/5 precursor [Eupentacta fraudatrix]